MPLLSFGSHIKLSIVSEVLDMFVHVQSEQRASLDRQHSHKTASFLCRCEFIYAFEQLC